MRQEIRGLVEQIDPELVVLDADMDMHAADHQTARHVLEILGEDVVALLVGMLLGPPFGEGMGGRRNRRQPELIGDAADRAAQMDELVARLRHGLAYAGADLDLRAQEFGADLSAQRFLALGEQRRRRLLGQVAAILVDEEIFLLDAEGEAWFLDGHDAQCGTKGEAGGSALAGSDQSLEQIADEVGHAGGGHADRQVSSPARHQGVGDQRLRSEPMAKNVALVIAKATGSGLSRPNR